MLIIGELSANHFFCYFAMYWDKFWNYFNITFALILWFNMTATSIERNKWCCSFPKCGTAQYTNHRVNKSVNEHGCLDCVKNYADSIKRNNLAFVLKGKQSTGWPIDWVALITSCRSLLSLTYDENQSMKNGLSALQSMTPRDTDHITSGLISIN